MGKKQRKLECEWALRPRSKKAMLKERLERVENMVRGLSDRHHDLERIVYENKDAVEKIKTGLDSLGARLASNVANWYENRKSDKQKADGRLSVAIWSFVFALVGAAIVGVVWISVANHG